MRIHVFSGGRLGSWALRNIHDANFIIGADRGAHFLVENNIIPDIALGDFDSVTEEQRSRIQKLARKWIECDPIMKDMTDTEMAYDEALKQGADHICLYGTLGTRFDHSLANVHLLRKSLQQNVRCTIEDEYNRIQLIDENNVLELTKDHFTYVSLLPLTPEVTGIYLSGFEYPLHNATLCMGQSLGISNKISDLKGSVRIESGQLLVICSRDEDESHEVMS